MENKILRAIYETKREELLIAKLQNTKNNNISDAYVYAYASRLCPVFHSQNALELGQSDPFEEIYHIKRESILVVLNYCDEKWGNNDKIDFNQLENRFEKLGRWVLIAILRYAYLSDKFDGSFFSMLHENHTTEYQKIDTPLSSDEIAIN